MTFLFSALEISSDDYKRCYTDFINYYYNLSLLIIDSSLSYQALEGSLNTKHWSKGDVLEYQTANAKSKRKISEKSQTAEIFANGHTDPVYECTKLNVARTDSEMCFYFLI